MLKEACRVVDTCILHVSHMLVSLLFNAPESVDVFERHQRKKVLLNLQYILAFLQAGPGTIIMASGVQDFNRTESDRLNEIKGHLEIALLEKHFLRKYKMLCREGWFRASEIMFLSL